MFIILGAERRKKIIEFIKHDNKVHVTELSELFDVAEETVRRDLARLEKDGFLSRTYGGAVSVEQTKEYPSFSTRTAMNLESKQIIGQHTTKIIHDNDTIMVDASTTGMEAVQSLRKKKNLTIITTSIRLASDLVNSKFTVICTGGTIRSHSFSLIGPLALSAVSNYHVDFTIIGCKSLSQGNGIMESNEAECEIKRRMMHQAKKTILVADHSKFDNVSFVKQADFNEIDYIVTDQKPSADWLEFLKDYNIELFY